MPLAFDSVSHGQVAFGFFNIDSDMLLLERYFFFATEFCRYINEMAQEAGTEPYEAAWEVYDIPEREKVGDLMGAIHGIHYSGFIGKVYLRFPFPKSPEDFKQKPEGYTTRTDMENMIEAFARPTTISFMCDQEAREVSIGPYRFTRAIFQELIRYVWRGGYPRWRDEIRPDYVMAMKEAAGRSSSPVLNGLELFP